MTTSAQSVLLRVVGTLQDASAVRWATNELVRYLNDGQRDITVYRPDATATTATLTCVSGTRQTLPAAASKLIDIVRNVATTSDKQVVRKVNRQMLDSISPSWHVATASVNISNYMYDPIDPRVFYVYPPATTLAQLSTVYSAYPTDITEPADNALYTTVSGNISVADIFANALADYILFRAFSKDAESSANAGRAQAHYALYTTALSTELRGTTSIAPSTSGAPNHG